MKRIRIAVAVLAALTVTACDSNKITADLSNRGAVECGPGPTMGSGC